MRFLFNLKQRETPNVLFFIACKGLILFPTENIELEQFSVLFKRKYNIIYTFAQRVGLGSEQHQGCKFGKLTKKL